MVSFLFREPAKYIFPLSFFISFWSRLTSSEGPPTTVNFIFCNSLFSENAFIKKSIFLLCPNLLRLPTKTVSKFLIPNSWNKLSSTPLGITSYLEGKSEKDKKELSLEVENLLKNEGLTLDNL